MVCSLKGYRTLSVTQLINIFFAVVHDIDNERYDAFRVLCAYLFLEGRQEATERSLKRAGRPLRRWDGPTTADLRAVVGGRTGIGRLLGRLEDMGLVTRVGNRLVVTETPLAGTEPLLAIVCGRKERGGYRRSVARAVPVPREWLLAWGRPTRSRAVELLHLFYSAAALAFKDKGSGKVENAARFKFEELVRSVPLHRSRMTLARRKLIEEGRISEDKTQVQWRLNREGHYVAVSLEWGRESEEPQTRDIGRPLGQKCSDIGRPWRDTKHSANVGRDQKRPGVWKGRDTGRGPSPENVSVEDIRRPERLRRLFRLQGWVPQTEAYWQLFVAAAIRAGEVGRKFDGTRNHPVKVFLGIVKRGLWTNLTNGQEERARGLANRFLERERVTAFAKAEHADPTRAGQRGTEGGPGKAVSGRWPKGVRWEPSREEIRRKIADSLRSVGAEEPAAAAA